MCAAPRATRERRGQRSRQPRRRRGDQPAGQAQGLHRRRQIDHRDSLIGDVKGQRENLACVDEQTTRTRSASVGCSIQFMRVIRITASSRHRFLIRAPRRYPGCSVRSARHFERGHIARANRRLARRISPGGNSRHTPQSGASMLMPGSAGSGKTTDVPRSPIGRSQNTQRSPARNCSASQATAPRFAAHGCGKQRADLSCWGGTECHGQVGSKRGKGGAAVVRRAARASPGDEGAARQPGAHLSAARRVRPPLALGDVVCAAPPSDCAGRGARYAAGKEEEAGRAFCYSNNAPIRQQPGRRRRAAHRDPGGKPRFRRRWTRHSTRPAPQRAPSARCALAARAGPAFCRPRSCPG
jgi:hypothetical protein